MRKNKSLVKNLGWQTAYQVISTCTPLITAPYLSRVLGAERIGLFSYTCSLALFFRMFGLLGNINYGTREIAIVRDDTQKRSRLFKELLCIQSVASIFSLIFYFAYCFLFETKEAIQIIQSLWIIDCFINISWLYAGMEEFKYTAVRGVMVKAFQLISMLLFVKTAEHAVRYAFIMAFSEILSNLILWLGARRIIDFRVKISLPEIKTHIKPTFILFIPVAAGSVFRLMDKLMLGRMSTNIQSGYYYNADHLVNIPLLVITGLCTVMLSRMSSISADRKKYRALFDTYAEVILLISVAMASGIGAIAQDFVPFFFGPEFEPCTPLVYIFVVIMVIKSASHILMSMYLIPTGKDKLYVTAVVFGALANILFNTLFIAVLGLGALGAALGTLVAEFVVMATELFLTKNEIGIGTILSKLIPYIMIGVIMFFIVRLAAGACSALDLSAPVKLLFEVLTGIAAYSLLTFLFLHVSKRFERLKNGIFGEA